MARSLDQILKELDAGYNPSRDLINQKLAALPGQADAEIGGLQAQQGQAFNDIVAGARDRGVGFSGIPIAEQAKYTSTNFLPAVARVKQSQNEVQGSLLGTLNDINLDQRKTGMGIYQTELDRDERERIRQQELAAQERASRAAAAQQSSLYGSLYGNKAPTPVNPKAPGLAPVAVSPADQTLFNQMFIRGDGTPWDDRSLVSDYNATLKSASYGNVRDKQKLAFYHQFKPNLFGSTIPASVLSNGGKLSY